jgi:transcriptional regulator with XRE-family HTH domain
MTIWTPAAILAARVDRNWSLEEASKRLDISRRTFIDWEQGRTAPNHEVLDRVFGGAEKLREEEARLTRELLKLIREGDSHLPEEDRRLKGGKLLIDPREGITIVVYGDKKT